MTIRSKQMKAIHASLLIVVGALAAGTAQADEALAKAKGCLACHTVEKKLVGPAYKDIAKRYAGQKDVEAKLAEKIIKGGKGAWAKELGAEIPMPPNTLVKPDEATKLVKWILSIK
jgi:cytochrome c